MPYIKQEDRKRIALLGIPRTVGELNYKLTKECLGYLAFHNLSYQSINDVIGALECCKQEFYSRVAQPYELKKQLENGDVY